MFINNGLKKKILCESLEIFFRSFKTWYFTEDQKIQSSDQPISQNSKTEYFKS
jgi:hypothetical protein